MSEISIYILVNCPYCKAAKRAVEKLKSEKEEYSSVELKWIDESKIKDFPDWCDYYYVPTIYLGETKFYEASPSDNDEVIYLNVKAAFDAALKEK